MKRKKSYTIHQLAIMMEENISHHLQEFHVLGKEVKLLLDQQGQNPIPSEEIKNIYVKMAKITLELQPVQTIIFQQYPKYKALFNSLKQLYIQPEQNFETSTEIGSFDQGK